MMERFLKRNSLSEYRDKFILKGGMLVAAMVGLDARSTMDLNATVRGTNVNVEDIVLAEHEPEILLHKAAKKAFDDMGVKKLPTVKSLQAEYAQLLTEKKKAYAEYRRSREEMRELLTAKANVDRLLNIEAKHDAEKEKDHGQR